MCRYPAAGGDWAGHPGDVPVPPEPVGEPPIVTQLATQEVTVLRKLGILENFVTSENAKYIAYKTKKNKKKIKIK